MSPQANFKMSLWLPGYPQPTRSEPRLGAADEPSSMATKQNLPGRAREIGISVIEILWPVFTLRQFQVAIDYNPRQYDLTRETGKEAFGAGIFSMVEYHTTNTRGRKLIRRFEFSILLKHTIGPKAIKDLSLMIGSALRSRTRSGR